MSHLIVCVERPIGKLHEQFQRPRYMARSKRTTMRQCRVVSKLVSRHLALYWVMDLVSSTRQTSLLRDPNQQVCSQPHRKGLESDCPLVPCKQQSVDWVVVDYSFYLVSVRKAVRGVRHDGACLDSCVRANRSHTIAVPKKGTSKHKHTHTHRDTDTPAPPVSTHTRQHHSGLFTSAKPKLPTPLT